MNVDRRRFALTLLAAGLMSGVAACGRRGALEPSPDTEQGRAWQKRVGGNAQQQVQQRAQPRPAGSVQAGLERDDDQRGTVDVEGQIERPRGEGLPRTPTDPTQTEAGQSGNTPLTGSRRRPPGIVPPKRSFILDGLLE
jgi:predicted small lipoprotein YifL